MLAHIRNGQLIQRYISEKGWVTLEDGRKASPPIDGFVDGNDRIVPVVEETNDTSTGTVPTVRTDTSWQVEADRVYRLITIRDMTQAELDARAAEEVQRASDDMDNRRELIALAAAIWHTKKGTHPADAFDSPAQYKQWLRSLL